MKREDLFSQRPGQPTDVPFISKTWIQGLYGGNHWFNIIPWEVYVSHYAKIIESVLARPSTQVTVTCLKDDPDCIIGYAVWDERASGRALHWVHVKAAWRNTGVARSTIPEGINQITHTTKAGLGMRNSMQQWEWVFNPFTL